MKARKSMAGKSSVESARDGLRCVVATALACAVALFASVAVAGDVFSDATSWRRGFSGSGLMPASSTTAFPESLYLGDAGHLRHTIAIKGVSNWEHGGAAHGVHLQTQNVVYPYANISNDETVAYFEQYAYHDGTNLRIAASTINVGGTFVVSNASTVGYSFFMRFRWDGTSITNAMTYLINASRVYSASNYGGSGLMIGFNPENRKFRVNEGSSVKDLEPNVYVSSNKWTDLMITVKNGRLEFYSCEEGGLFTHAGKNLSLASLNPNPVNTWVMIGGYSRSDVTTQMAYTSDTGLGWAFRGHIHSFASWPRALSEDEVRQVFSWPRTDVFRLGTENGSSLEFAGGASASVTAGPHTDWGETPASLTAENSSFSVNFNIQPQDAGLAQLLRVIPAGGTSGVLAVSVNGKTVGMLPVSYGHTARCVIEGGLFVSGANTLTLTRVSGSVSFDAITLGGGFRIGLKNNDWSEFSNSSGNNVYYAADGNWRHCSRALNAPYTSATATNRVHFSVYGGMPNVKVAFSVRLRPTYQEHHGFALYLNDSAWPLYSSDSLAYNEWNDINVDIPSERLQDGDNVLTLVNTSSKLDTWTDTYAYTQIDCFSFQPKPLSGLVLILR